MVSVEEALGIILSNSIPLGTEQVTIQEAVGRVLAEPVSADRDFPPFDRVAMDGIAVRFDDVQPGTRLRVAGIQPAGAPAQSLTELRAAMEVMTGAVLPPGTDTVIRYEDIRLEDGHAMVQTEALSRGMHVHPKGQDARAGEVLLSPGQLLGPSEIALLASVGQATVMVYAFPKTAVISTGDELVAIGEVPLPHQIRRSNVYALQAAMSELGWTADAFHFSDKKTDVQEGLVRILPVYDVIILTGGVSKGKFDYVPQVLESIGIVKHFHQVSQRPGKPLWFGSSHDRGKVVFAFPGNPVSTFLCFYKYVRPWMLRNLGMPAPVATALLTQDVAFAPPLTYFLQVSAHIAGGKLLAEPRAGGGSGDFVNLKDVNGFLELPSGKTHFKAGESYPYIPFRH